MPDNDTPTPQSPDLHEFFAKDPAAADRAFFGRETCSDRRGFLRGAGLATMAAMVGAAIPFHRNMPGGLIPAAFADENVLVGKDGLTLLNDRPVNAETPPHLLDDAITPTARHFIRNNGIPPAEADPATWTLTVDGMVDNPMTYSIADLQSKFEVVTMVLAIECGGNGRAFFDPPAKGNQWTYGAVACSEWTGVRLKDVLAAGGVQSGVVYTAHVGADAHLSGEPGKLAISRRSSDREGHDRQRADRLRPERRAAPSHERGAAAARGTGLAGLVLAEVAPANLAAGRRPRRPEDDRQGLPRAELQGGGGREGRHEGLRHHRADAGEVAGHEPGERSGHRSLNRGAGPRLVGRPDGGRGGRLLRLRGDLDGGGARCPGQRRCLAELSGRRWKCPRPVTTRFGPAPPTAKA